MTRRTSGMLVSSLLIGVVVVVAFPLVELWLDCNPPRIPRSEGCMWGQSLLPPELLRDRNE